MKLVIITYSLRKELVLFILEVIIYLAI